MSIGQQQRKFLLVAPALVLPFLFMMFFSLGGGRGQDKKKDGSPAGLNTSLPGAWPGTKQVLLNKMASYEKAAQDSAKKREAEQRDPYHPYLLSPRVADSNRRSILPTPADHKAETLIKQLDRLQQSLQHPVTAPAPHPAYMPMQPRPVFTPPVTRPATDIPAADPQLERLNAMLDKVIRIQHPGESRAASPGSTAASPGGMADEVLPADSASNAITAIIPSNQTLVSGTTIALRLTEDVMIHGLRLPGGQLVYGVVTINSDRMLVHIHSLRNECSLYTTDMQVYDLDGLPGIHIPGMISRDVAKESADESVSGLNLTTYDPSLGAQAANAGIQAAKTLFSRKVRVVRVSVRAGYKVLLRNSQSKTFGPVRHIQQSNNLNPFLHTSYQPPGFVPGGSFIEQCRNEGMELGLQGIYLQDSVLWFALSWHNRSPIGYYADFCRWVVRDRQTFKRTAEQDQPIEPVYADGPMVVGGDSTCRQWVGFRPFALAKDKELAVEVGEKNGGRVMELVIGYKELLKAKRQTL